MDFRVTNITASFSVNRKFVLEELSQSSEENRVVKRRWKRSRKPDDASPSWTRSRASHNGGRKKFQSVRQRIVVSGKNVTALIYSSGAVVLVGANAVEQIHEAKEKILEMYDCSVAKPLTVSNFAFASKYTKPVNLEKIYSIAREKGGLFDPLFEPELFPSLLLTLKNTNTNARVFKSGSIIISGCRTLDQGIRMYNLLIELIQRVQ